MQYDVVFHLFQYITLSLKLSKIELSSNFLELRSFFDKASNLTFRNRGFLGYGCERIFIFFAIV